MGAGYETYPVTPHETDSLVSGLVVVGVLSLVGAVGLAARANRVNAAPATRRFEPFRSPYLPTIYPSESEAPTRVKTRPTKTRSGFEIVWTEAPIVDDEVIGVPLTREGLTSELQHAAYYLAHQREQGLTRDAYYKTKLRLHKDRGDGVLRSTNEEIRVYVNPEDVFREDWTHDEMSGEGFDV